MRPKSGLPKRKALKREPQFAYGFRDNPATAEYRHSSLTKGGNVDPSCTTVTSLFCGCGGLDLSLLGGFRYLRTTYDALPFRILHAYDIDPQSVRTYRLNIGNHITEADLTKIDLASLPTAELLTGGFPCQDFSSCGHKKGLKGARGELYTVVRDYMHLHAPKVVVAENVPHLGRMHGGSVLNHIVADLSSVGYRFNVWKLCCPDYGLPQSRTRLFLVGVREDLPGFPKKPIPTHFAGYVTIDDALADLEKVEDESVPNQSQYFVATKATAGAGQGDQKCERGKISYTMRANAKARVQFHYSLDRRLTVRECARLQSFPDEFIFPHAASHNIVEIGNAVPPIVGYHVAKAIAEYFRDVVNNPLRDDVLRSREAGSQDARRYAVPQYLFDTDTGL